MIARLLQEDLDREHAQNLASGSEPSSSAAQTRQRPGQYYDQESPSVTGIRRGDSQYQEQLIGGPDQFGFGYGPTSYNYSQTTGPDGVTHTHFYSHGFPQQHEPPQPHHQMPPPSTGPQRHHYIEEDSHMEQMEHMDEDEALSRALAESISQSDSSNT